MTLDIIYNVFGNYNMIWNFEDFQFFIGSDGFHEHEFKEFHWFFDKNCVFQGFMHEQATGAVPAAQGTY